MSEIQCKDRLNLPCRLASWHVVWPVTRTFVRVKHGTRGTRHCVKYSWETKTFANQGSQTMELNWRNWRYLHRTGRNCCSLLVSPSDQCLVVCHSYLYKMVEGLVLVGVSVRNQGPLLANHNNRFSDWKRTITGSRIQSGVHASTGTNKSY